MTPPAMSTIRAETSYLASGANRHPSAADWDSISGILAYGADRNVVLWRPQVRSFDSFADKTDFF
jgi:hypothetical protein